MQQYSHRYDLDVGAKDVGNAYFHGPCHDCIYTITGPEIAPELQGKVLLIICARWTSKSSGTSWRAMFVVLVFWGRTKYYQQVMMRYPFNNK
jgi:hypothetical protein